MTPIKAYLLLYNAISTALWARLLFITVSFLVTNRPGPAASSVSWWSRVIAASPTARRIFSALPSPVAAVSNYLAGSYSYKDLGYLTKYTQSLAALEVVHAALGLVRSPVGTTAAQVASRLYTVWGVVEAVPSVRTCCKDPHTASCPDHDYLRRHRDRKLTGQTHNSPLFATMLLAWSLTEVIRYSFYFFSLLNISIPILNWLRYTTFYALYPLGASSEAFIAFSTLPPFSNLPIPDSIRALNPLRAIIGFLPEGVKHAMVKTVWGRRILFNLAKLHANAKGVVRGQKWEAVDYARLVLFVGWWPGESTPGHTFPELCAG